MQKQFTGGSMTRRVLDRLDVPVYNDTTYCSSETCKNYDCFRNPWNIPFGKDQEGNDIFLTNGFPIRWEDYTDDCIYFMERWIS